MYYLHLYYILLFGGCKNIIMNCVPPSKMTLNPKHWNFDYFSTLQTHSYCFNFRILKFTEVEKTRSGEFYSSPDTKFYR